MNVADQGVNFFDLDEAKAEVESWFNVLSGASTAFSMCAGARCEYLKVMVKLLCPKSLDTVVRSTPARKSVLKSLRGRLPKV